MMYNRLSEFAQRFEILYCYQFGFRKNHSTDLAVIQLVDKIPWISKGILVSVRKKNRLYKMFIKRPTARREQQYKAYKNKLNYLIRIAKRTYYDDEFA